MATWNGLDEESGTFSLLQLTEEDYEAHSPTIKGPLQEARETRL